MENLSRTRPWNWIIGLATVCVFQVSNADGGPQDVGQWAAASNWGMQTVHAIVLKNGKVLAIDRYSQSPLTDDIKLFDPSTGNLVSLPNPPGLTLGDGENIFCSGHAQLPDGKVVFFGGGFSYASAHPHTVIFNTDVTDSSPPYEANLLWTMAANMPSDGTDTGGQPGRRWYPTAMPLADGKILVLGGGNNGVPGQGNIPLIFNPSPGSGPQFTQHGEGFFPAPENLKSLNWYPFTFPFPDGTIFMGGSHYYDYNTAGPDVPARRLTLTAGSGSWTTITNSTVKGGSSVMYRPYKVMKAGGGLSGAQYGHCDSTPISDRSMPIDLSAASPAWSEAAPMNSPRLHFYLTVLPDGKILATGGAWSTTGGACSPELDVEMYNPDSPSAGWSLMAPMSEARMYHSAVVLLPDGRVLAAGGQQNNISQLTAQIFSPPYLFNSSGGAATRPEILTVGPVTNTLRYGLVSRIGTPAAGQQNVKVALVGLGGATHSFDQGQRYIPLTVRLIPTSGSAYLEIDAPSNGNEAPPGYYMLFILQDGVPSVARMVKLERCSLPTRLVADPIRKNRFITLTASPNTGSMAIRVRLERYPFLEDFQSFEGQVRYVGPPQVFTESSASGIVFVASSLQCEPYYRDWTNFKSCSLKPKICVTSGDCGAGEGSCTVTVNGPLHITGSTIVPNAVYHAVGLGSSCAGSEATCTDLSCPVELKTARWGDVVAPLIEPNSNDRPDMGDVGELVDKFKDDPSAPIKVLGPLAGSDLYGNITTTNPNPNSSTGVGVEFSYIHIAACLNAFRGGPYPHVLQSCP